MAQTLQTVTMGCVGTTPNRSTARTTGERIRAGYLARGLNRSQLQRALGVAYTTILAWERDESTPSGENLHALSVLLGVSTSYLMGEDDTVTEPQFEAWGEFLHTPMGQNMTPAERRMLASLKPAPSVRYC